jgi:hypothetical protein
VDDLVLHHGHMGTLERTLSGGRVREHRAQREHVRGRGDALSERLLRCAVARSEERLAGGGEGQPVFGTGDAEVDDAWPVRGEHDVRRLEITVDEARRVDVGEGVGEGRGQGAQRGLGERAVRLDRLVQGETGEELAGDPRAGALGPRLQYGRDSPAAHGLCGPRLAHEAPAEIDVVGEFGPQHLDRGQGAVAALADVDLAHSAFAEDAEEPVGAEADRVPGAERVHRRCPYPGGARGCFESPVRCPRCPVRALGVPAGGPRTGRTWAFGRCGEGGPPARAGRSRFEGGGACRAPWVLCGTFETPPRRSPERVGGQLVLVHSEDQPRLRELVELCTCRSVREYGAVVRQTHRPQLQPVLVVRVAGAEDRPPDGVGLVRVGSSSRSTGPCRVPRRRP